MKNVVLLAFALLSMGAVQAAKDPEAVYNRSCGVCHNGQLPTAPQKGDAAAWAPRMAVGMETLVKHVTEDFNAMHAPWLVQGLQRRGLPGGDPSNTRLAPAQGEVSAKRDSRYSALVTVGGIRAIR